MPETLLAHCPNCHETVRIVIRRRMHARDHTGRPVWTFRATEVAHRCPIKEEP